MTPSEYLASQPLSTRRLFAVLLLAVVGTALWQAILVPLGHLLLSQDNWRATALQELGYQRGIVATEHEATQQLQALRSSSTWRGLFQGDSLDPSEALKSEIARMLNAAGAASVRLTSMPAEEEGGLRKYGLHVVASLDAGQMKRFLESLRSQSHYLRIEHLELTAPIVQSPDSNPPLELKADIFGYANAQISRGNK